MSNTLYIEIFVPCEIYGRTYPHRTQLLYVSQGYRTIDHKENPNNASALYYVGLNCDEEEVLIPAEYGCLTDICILEPNIQKYLTQKMSSKINDYFEFVKTVFDIDMNRNYGVQVNREYYDKLYLKPPIGIDDSTVTT